MREGDLKKIILMVLVSKGGGIKKELGSNSIEAGASVHLLVVSGQGLPEIFVQY